MEQRRRQFTQFCKWYGIGHNGRGFEDIREPRRYIRGGYEFLMGRSCCIGRDVGFPRQRRGLPLWLRLLFEVNFVFRASMSYTKTLQLTIYQSLVCSLVPKTISSRWVLLLENLQKITNSPALSFTNLLGLFPTCAIAWLNNQCTWYKWNVVCIEKMNKTNVYIACRTNLNLKNYVD
jgi:hypothetical protein